MWEATLSSMGHTSGDSPASNLAGPPIQGISCGMVIGAPFSTLVLRLEQNRFGLYPGFALVLPRRMI